MSEEGMYYHLSAWSIKEEDLPLALDVLKQERDKTLAEDMEIVPAYPDCTHPELSMTVSIEHDRVFWCPNCGKKIEIPMYTEAIMSQSDMAGIVGMAFGERWKRHLEEMEHE